MLQKLGGIAAVLAVAAFFAWAATRAPSGSGLTPPSSPEELGEIPEICVGWRPSPPKPPSATPGPDDFPAGEWDHLACSEDGCIAKAQVNAWRYESDTPFRCDYDEAMWSQQVICDRSVYDEDENLVNVVLISCPATWYADCTHVEARQVFVPHEIVTVKDVADTFAELCGRQAERARTCEPWCAGPDPDPECSPHWSAMDSCRELHGLMEEIRDYGELAIHHFDRPD